MLALHLTEENSRLTAAVEAAKKKLIELEIENGIKQIPLPNQPPLIAISESKPSQIIPETPQQQQQQPEPPKASKLKKDKKPPKEQPATEEPPVDIGRLDLRVAKVLEVQKHPDADSLYVLKIDCGEEKPRTVCSGLVKHVPMAELQNRMVVLLCNLKPVKMRGVTSEAMVMCASSPEAVEVLSPPEGASPGEPVCCPGFERRPDAVMNPKKKIFESVAPDLHTNGELEACYKNVAFEVPGKGRVVAKSLKNVAVK